MKKTKGMQRLWAFLLAFVLIATTVGNDGLTVLASENETEQSSEASSETHSAETSENTNSGGEEENSGENKSNQEEAAESSSESASESSEEPSAESTSASQEEELSTETSEEESKTEENTESISEEANQNSKWKVNFNTEGDVKVFKEDGQEITGTLEVENGKQLSFKVEAGEGTSVKVTADNNELSSENGIYKINPDKDITVTVKAEKNDNAEASTETETETETITESAAETETETETETKTEAETETESETETEIETESEIETETEEVLETETEDVIREFSVVSFQVEGKGSITDADGNEIGSQVEVENKKSLEFYVNPEDGYEVAEVIIDGTVISRSDNKYAVSPSKDVEIKVTFAEKEEEEEYVETIDTVEVNGVTIKVTTYSAGVLPKGYKVVAEEVSAGTVQNAVETKLEEKGKELVDLRAFDITILDKDGNEIQPKGGVSVQILGTGVEGENFDIYHMSGDEAQSVAENRKNSDVSFTANSFSIWVVAGSGSKYVTDETVYLKVKETKTLSAGSFEYNNNWTTSNKNIVEINGTGDSITIKGVRQGTAVITHEYKNGLGKKVKETTTIKVTSDDKQAVVAYFYVLLPEREIGSTKAGDYFYVGQGSVIPYDGDTQRSDLVQHQGTSNVVTYPDKEQVLQAVKQRYGSDIEVEDVIWYKTPWADGANSNTDKPLVNAGTKCYHVDGYVTYSTVNYTTVAFKAVPPGAGADADESNFELVDYYNKVKLLNGKATVTPTTKSATSINGYVFEGWYSDKACTQKVTDWTINGPTTYYGHYVPNMDDTRELKYQVVYQTEEGTILDTVTEKVNIWVEADSYIVEKVESKTFTGYKQKDDSPKLPQEVKDNDKVIVLYEADKNAKVEVKYTVQHWVAGVHQSDDDVEVTDKVWVNGAKELKVTADSLAQNTYPGYKFSSYAPADIKAGSVVADKQIIRVNYEKDEDAKVEVKYTVQHWVAGVHQSDDDVEVTDKVWVNGAKELKVTADSLAQNTYPGYKFSSYAPADIKAGSVVADKQIIRVNYEKDEDAKVEVKYTVQHWVAGVHQSDDDVEVTDKVWVNGAKELKVTADSLAQNTYPGYKFSSYAPADIKAGSVVADKQIIRVNYEKDEDAKVEVKYTVQHWVAGVHQSDDDVEVTDKVWVNGAKELKVTADSLAQNTYPGYKFSSYAPADIKAGSVVADKQIIRVNYEKDEDAKVEVKYTVQHWVAGVHQSDDDVEVTDKVWVNGAKELKVTADSLAQNTYPGYKFSSYAPADIKAGSVVADKQIIRVNYEKDEDAKVEVKYTVQHWVAGVHQSDDDVEVTDKVWVNGAKELKVTADSLAQNTYPGYKFSSYAPADIKAGSVVADKQIIRVNYEKDEDAKVEVKYTVQHWVAGVHQSDDDVEVTDKVWVNGAKELTVTADSLAQNNYTGYTFDNYNPADIKEGMTVSDGDVIKVNYLENEVTINYIADANGNVSNTSETILAVNGTATGSTATADTGYHFVNWTNEEGTVVSTDETYIPERVNELYAAATYTAHFEADVVTPPAPTPTPDEPTETTPTGTTPTVTAPTEATAVLGEAFAPVQPEVGVLGEAAAPEVGVLGEAKGPGTGDTAPIAAWSLIIVGAILTLGISAKKRKKEEQ
ncbi:InlB B-repeat-containing protein [Eisenbergiella tayi]|uniref:InlB B-repeat-containing protein n=1 Tax=Eisenbergiella tayi TaxID=1432052 RepID=UPI00307BC9BE